MEIDAVQILAELRRSGIAAPGVRMPTAALAAITDHLAKAPVFDAHVWALSSRAAHTLDEGLETACSTMETVATAPGMLDLVDQFTPLAEAYFGEPALLYSLNAFWTAPGPSVPNSNIQSWHRDRDDRKFLVMFIYGSDVLAPEDGTHLYARGSHRDDSANGGEVVEVRGQAGTIFFADTSGRHFGLKPTRGRRMMLWARWGVTDPPPVYLHDELAPVARVKVPHAYADHLHLVMR
jgi:hypothetical protein